MIYPYVSSLFGDEFVIVLYAQFHLPLIRQIQHNHSFSVSGSNFQPHAQMMPLLRLGL